MTASLLVNWTAMSCFAIAEHERVPEVSAVAIGSELVQHTDGIQHIYRMLAAVIDRAMERGDMGYAQALKATLDGFLSEFPAAAG